MNARMMMRSTAGLTTAVRPAQRLAPQSAMVSKRFASSEAIGSELASERQHSKEHAGQSAELWRKVSIYVCVPFSIVLGTYIYGVEAEHLHHRDHEIAENGGELPETTAYEYNDMRKKPFPWAGNGQNNSFFFNPKANRNIEM